MNQHSIDISSSSEIIPEQLADSNTSQTGFPWESTRNQQTETPTNPPEEEPVANQIILKSSDFGGIILPENTDKNSTYNIASIDLDPYRNSCVYFNFSCNIATLNAQIQVKFQLYKQEQNQVIPLPVGSSFNFIRMSSSTQSDMFSFSAYDQNLRISNFCNYSVCIEVMSFNTVGTVMITNPVLVALIM